MNEFAYSDLVYSPESTYAIWLNLSYILLTTGLVFYHMTTVNTIKATETMAGTISIILILISCVYMIYALVQYITRMDHVIQKCMSDPKCAKDQLDQMYFIKYSYTVLGILTSVVQLFITWLIFRKLRRKV